MRRAIAWRCSIRSIPPVRLPRERAPFLNRPCAAGDGARAGDCKPPSYLENTGRARRTTSLRLRRPSIETPRTLAPYPPVTTEGSSRSFADTPQPIARPATLMPNRIRTTSSGVTMSPLLYLAVAGLVAIAITASFGGSSFRLMRANGTSAFSEADQAHSPQRNFDPVPVARGAGVPPPSAAAGISDVSYERANRPNRSGARRGGCKPISRREADRYSIADLWAGLGTLSRNRPKSIRRCERPT